MTVTTEPVTIEPTTLQNSDIASHGVTTETREAPQDLITTKNPDLTLMSDGTRKSAELVWKWLQNRYGTSPRKLVVAVGGPSGSGKSEVGALIVSHYRDAGIPALLVACDNFPRRAPTQNDAYRRELFDTKGPDALAAYLGSEDEILFSRLSEISDAFQREESTVNLRKINGLTGEITDPISTNVSGVAVLVFEGTWSCRIPGLTESVFIATDFRKTAGYRAKRGRIEIQNDENRRFIEEFVLPFEQVALEKIRDTLATLWLVYEDDGTAALVERRQA